MKGTMKKARVPAAEFFGFECGAFIDAQGRGEVIAERSSRFGIAMATTVGAQSWRSGHDQREVACTMRSEA